MAFEFSPKSLQEIATLLAKNGVQEALIKRLSKNHNDKNQVYSGTDFAPLYPMFDFEFRMRGLSTSLKRSGQTSGKNIPEAVFNHFTWLERTGREIPARNARMIIYPQYPETRLSGFSTIDNTMPKAMSVEFTKKHGDRPRYLILGRRGAGQAVAVMVVDPSDAFVAEVDSLPNATGSRVWRHARFNTNATARLFSLLSQTTGLLLPGRRLTFAGETQPFNGTQVCGYTLEHALGIRPNSDKDGDFEGIELKTHTQKKVTLFTPEPDLGVYANDFARFMEKYGYLDADGNYRLTGIHRVGVRCGKSGLTLEIINHERGRSLAASADKNVHLGLMDSEGSLAAGWSLDRILNNWTAKHNETVYVPASKFKCDEPELVAKGHKHLVQFSDRVMWCRETSAERLFEALYNGTLFLDPAPKFSPEDPKLNKRRSQWRVNDITLAARDLYGQTEFISLKEEAAA